MTLTPDLSDLYILTRLKNSNEELAPGLTKVEISVFFKI